MNSHKSLGSIRLVPRLAVVIAIATVFGLAMCSSFAVLAADSAKADKRDADSNAKDLPPPEDQTLTTNDGLRLALTYYPATKDKEKGKNVVPVVLLHMWRQTRSDYSDLAGYLQSQGYAVVVPDLRGHGQSTRFKGARKDDDLKAATLPATQYPKMVLEDMRAVRDFLWERNNACELNIDKLCVIGAEMGASVALNFAGYDAIGCENNMAYYGPLKLGEFVKALVLISPEWSFKNLHVRQALVAPRVQRDIAVLILVGDQEAKAVNQAKRVYDVFERFHPEPVGTDRIDRKTLFFIRLDTSLQGTKLLDPNLNVPEIITDFLQRRLIKSEESLDWVWKERKHPYE
jgi:pimeloyl-ACP methyl ester carboxylesterase